MDINNENKNPITDQQHERLCAYLFEELDAETRAAFELELATNPALQIERKKIESSMELVREFAPEAPAELSTTNREALTAAVGGAASGPAPIIKLAWYRRPVFQVAVAASVVAVSLFDFQKDSLFGRRADSPGSLDRVALYEAPKSDKEFRPVLDVRQSGDRIAMREVIFSLDGDGENAARTKKLINDADLTKEQIGDLKALGYGGGDSRVTAGLELAEKLLDPASYEGLDEGPDDVSIWKVQLVAGTAVDAPMEEKSKARGREEVQASVGASGAVRTGGRKRFLTGVDEKDGAFQGPGDSVPPSGTQSHVTATSTPQATPATADTLAAEGFKNRLTPGAFPNGMGGGAPGDSVDHDAFPLEAMPVQEPAQTPSPGYYYDDGEDGDLKLTTSDLFGKPLGEVLAEVGGQENSDGSAGSPATTLDDVTSGLEDMAGLGYFADEEVEESDEDLVFGRVPVRTSEEETRLAAEFEAARRITHYEQLIKRTERLPDEKPSAMYFRYWGDNGFEFPSTDPLSTFSADADTASYTLARRMIKDGYLPQRAQIRTEEFVNYFTPDVAAPTGDAVFNITHELSPSLFGPNSKDAVEAASKAASANTALAEGSVDRWLLRVGVRGEVIPIEERSPLALTFVIDVSGSMESDNRIGLVKHALRLLSTELDERDSISIIAFSQEATRVLQMQSAGDKANFERALFELNTGGGTNVQSGLRMGYEEAVLGFVEGATNRVVFLSDGVGNIAETDQEALLAETKRAREKGIYLNTIGVGMGNHNDTFLEQLANGGDGLCNYVDDADEAERALVRNFTGAFQPIARDVKLQVDFDPGQVTAYRLLGYENRAIADVDFRNDKVDAGELGSGHQVVALYELVLGNVDTSGETPLATTRLRYKLPYLTADEAGEDMRDTALEIESGANWSHASGSFEGASIGFQKSALAAEFAEMLRRSSHARHDSVSLLRYKLDELAKSTSDAEILELAALVQLAQPQLEAALLNVDPVTQAANELARFEWRCGTSTYLNLPLDDADETRDILRERLLNVIEM